jgi:aminoglycoside phosphotransferase (APT) family kinase protein
VVKRGPRNALSREAAALRVVAGLGVAPALVAAGAGVVVCERLPGEPRDPVALGEGDARALGALVRRVHDVPPAALDPATWSSTGTLADYRRERVAAALALAAAAGVPPLAFPPAGDAAGARRFLHGDLVAANVVWGPGGPRLVDWEFARAGDPAEDLAYLAELNRLTPAALAAVLRGHGDAAVAARVEAWRPIVAYDAGAWYLREGVAGEGERLVARAAALLAGPGRTAGPPPGP